MNLLKSYLMFLLGIFLIPNVYSQNNYEQCKDYSQQVNKYLPTSINNYTIFDGTYCIPSNIKSTFVYNMTFDTKLVRFEPQNRIQILNGFCSNKEQLVLLKKWNVQYQYNSISGVFLGKIDISIDECRK